MEHDQEILELIAKREVEGEPLNCVDLTEWCGNSQRRYNALVEAIGKEILTWKQIETFIKEPDKVYWRHLNIPSQWVLGPIEPVFLLELADQVKEEFGISFKDPRFERYMAEKLLSGKHITVEPRVFREWIKQNFPPGPVERLGKVSDLLRVLDLTHHALYVEDKPPKDATAHTEKTRIEDWLESNYEIRPKNLKYIARILNPFPFPRKSAPPVKKEK